MFGPLSFTASWSLTVLNGTLGRNFSLIQTVGSTTKGTIRVSEESSLLYTGIHVVVGHEADEEHSSSRHVHVGNLRCLLGTNVRKTTSFKTLVLFSLYQLSFHS